MTVIRVSEFKGENRAAQPSLLMESLGTVSRNQKPGRGDLRPWKAPTMVATIPSGRSTIYRMGRDVASDANYWLSWPTVVHLARGFDPEDTTERTYYTGDGTPKVTSTTLALASAPYPTASRPLGMPAPTSKPTTVAAGGVATTLETRFYVYTFVNDWGWESAPSPVSTQLNCKPDATITISSFDSAPAGNYGVNRIRVYRTQAGTSGNAGFFFLREITYGVGSTTDDRRSLAEILPTTTWLPPPADLKFLTPLWNGMMAGISGNAVRFCEVNLPYAWPIAYDAVPPEGTPVALGKYGQNLLVLTTGRPLLVAGSAPDSMDQAPLEMSQGCISPRSVVSMGNGVAWASMDGLCFFGGSARILTTGVMTREDWLALRPETIIGTMYEGLYFGSYDDGTGRKGFLIDPSNPQGMYFLDEGYLAVHFDELQDQLFVLKNNEVQKWDAGARMSVRFRSKVFRMPRPIVSFAWGEVVSEDYPLTFTMFADGVQKYTVAVANGNPFRLPSGYHATEWQVEVSGPVAIRSVALGHSAEEMATV